MKTLKIIKIQVGTVVHTCNSITREAEGGGLRVQSQPGLHSKSLYQKKKKSY
jgi:hypothetical protein